MCRDPERPTLPPRLLLYDGTCAVCDATVRWVLAHDPGGRWWFAPLQGPTAAAIRRRYPQWPPALDSLVVVERVGGEERLAWYSTAVLRVLVDLGGPLGAVARVVSWIPAPVRDLAYRAFARLRYRLFGRVDRCRVPETGQERRFLD